MGIENRSHFGRERLRMPDRDYSSHVIGDRCPLLGGPSVEEDVATLWRNLRYGRFLKEELRKLREYLSLNSGLPDSSADFKAGTTFEPDVYPHGTIILAGREGDIYITTRTRVRREPYRSPLRGPDIASVLYGRPDYSKPEWQDKGLWLEKEDYNDRRLFRGNHFGIIIRLPNTPHNQTVLLQNSWEEIMKGKADLRFIEGQVPISSWNHLVTSYLGPGYNPDKKVYTQDDLFDRFTGIQILEVGKGVKEEVRRPLGRLSTAIRRALGST